MNQKSFGFIPWLVFFFVALVSIPFFIWFDFLGIAKFVGIAVTLSLVVVLRIWLYRLGKLGKAPRVSLNANDVYELNRIVPALAALPLPEQRAFQHRIGLIMSHITVQHEASVSSINTSPKVLAMVGASLFLMNGLESRKELTFLLSEYTTLQVSDNQLSISLDAAMDVLSSLSIEQIALAIAA
jgi:hypothetical protein